MWVRTGVRETFTAYMQSAPTAQKRTLAYVGPHRRARNGSAAHASCSGNFEKIFPRLRPPRVRGTGTPFMGRVPAGIFLHAGRHRDEKVYTFSTLQAAGRPVSVKISLPSCTEGRMCYNFFNKKPHRSLMKTRILSRHGAGPAGAARYGAPSGSGNLHTAGRRRFRTVFPPAAAGPDASRREPCFFFPFFCAVCCNVMHGNV